MRVPVISEFLQSFSKSFTVCYVKLLAVSRTETVFGFYRQATRSKSRFISARFLALYLFGRYLSKGYDLLLFQVGGRLANNEPDGRIYSLLRSGKGVGKTFSALSNTRAMTSRSEQMEYGATHWAAILALEIGLCREQSRADRQS